MKKALYNDQECLIYKESETSYFIMPQYRWVDKLAVIIKEPPKENVTRKRIAKPKANDSSGDE